VVRGDPAGISCSVFCFREGRLLGVETVNRPADHMAARRLVGNHIVISPADAADESVDLKRLATAAAGETRA
jgi:3-phenylpropionate/trans-cinnamate dioxygenase ferredoxin reductase subunit